MRATISDCVYANDSSVGSDSKWVASSCNLLTHEKSVKFKLAILEEHKPRAVGTSTI